MDYENIRINSQEYKKLSEINKLKVVRLQLDELFNEKAKKSVVVIYNGEKKQINKGKIGYFKSLVQRERKLEKQLSYINFNLKKEETFNFLKAYIEKEFKSDSFEKLSYDEKIKIINEKKNYFYNSIKENGKSKDVMEVLDYLEDIRIKTDIERISNNIEKKNTFNENNNLNKKKSKKEKKRIKLSLLALPIIYGIKNSIKNNRSVFLNKLKNNGSALLSKLKNNHTNLLNKAKKHKTKIAAAICACIIAVTGFSGLNSRNNKDANLTAQTAITSVDKHDKDDNDKKLEVVNKEEKEEVKVEDNTINLNDRISIEENASVYTNSYDASNNNNPYDPLYDSSYERSVEGLSYELDGKIYTIYQNDEKAMDKINLLTKSGAILKAVLVTRTDLANETTYEGYYNASNVRVRVR